MDSGVDGQLYSSDCNSPFTSTSSMDSLGGGAVKNTVVEASGVARKKQRKAVIESIATIRPQEVSHKRPLSNSTSGSCMGLKDMLSGGSSLVRNDTPAMSPAKRIKCDNVAPSRTLVLNTLASASSQLLQQLMAPAKSQSVKVKVVAATRKGADMMDTNAAKMVKLGGCRGNDTESKKGFGEQAVITKKQQPAPASSNSVLMNLLVSGCDVSAGYTCLAPMRPRKAAKV